MNTTASALTLATLCAACATRPHQPHPVAEVGAPAALADPTQEEVTLGTRAGWTASLVLDNQGVGVWTVGTLKIFPQFACPEIAALDDRGRFHALWSYSGKWTPVSTIHDGKWLGGLVQDDLDPRVPGTEIYTGSQGGNLWQVTAHQPTVLDSRLIAQLPGREVHTLIGGELDPSSPGKELLAFTRPGRLFQLRPREQGDGFEVLDLGELPGRIRDALVLPAAAGATPEVAVAGRHGRVELLRLEGGRPSWQSVVEIPMGLGRLALKPGSRPEDLVLYCVTDDGRVLRNARDAAGRWSSELIYAGPQGMRGCAAGRFDADPAVETVAVFGYSKRVELLTRGPDGWRVETIFEDLDKGHWLCAGEFDGRNATEELVTAGYSGRVVLLSRPPGHGLSGVLATESHRPAGLPVPAEH